MDDVGTSGYQATNIHNLQLQIEWLDTQQYLRDAEYISLIQQINQHSEHQDGEITVHLQTFVDGIGTKIKMLMTACVSQMGELRLKMNDVLHQLEQKKQTIQTQNQTIQTQHSKLESWQQEYDHLRQEMNEMQEQYQRRLREVKRQKKEIKQTFRMVQENTELQRQLMQNLQIQKEEINQQIISEKKEKEELFQELIQIKHKFIVTEQKLAASATKLTWEQKRIRKLQDELTQKSKMIERLMLQIQQNNHENTQTESISIRNNSINRQFRNQNGAISSFASEKPVGKDKKVSFVQIFKLSDQIETQNINDEFEIPSHKSIAKMSIQDAKSIKSFEQLQINKSQINDQQQIIDHAISFNHSNPIPFIPDLYFAHFILTSQSIKIKLNRQELLGIDIRPYYPVAIQKGVPFHMWDQWISEQLKSYVNN